jgi:hypothetical protein
LGEDLRLSSATGTQNSLNSSLGTGKLRRTWLTEAENGENGAFGKENMKSVGNRVKNGERGAFGKENVDSIAID